jgi:predicted transposase/invertase (TIGR01784 family)
MKSPAINKGGHQMTERKFYGMRNDYMFKAVLQESREVLRNLVAVLMGIDESTIASCEIVNPIELGKSMDAKECILDVKLVLNDTQIINIELQIRKEASWPERSLLYWSRAFDCIRSGDDYSLLKPTYHIGILDFTLFENNPEFYAEYLLMSRNTGKIYTDKISMRVLDLSKIENAREGEEKLVKWAKIFRAKTMAELETLAAGEEVLKSMVAHIRELSEEEKIRQQCEAREDYERRLLTEYRAGERSGIEQGVELTAIKMKKEGIAVSTIVKCTGLTEKQVLELG